LPRAGRIRNEGTEARVIARTFCSGLRISDTREIGRYGAVNVGVLSTFSALA